MAFIKTHQPCLDPECGSSDGLAYNEDGTAKCFVCKTVFKDVDGEAMEQAVVKKATPVDKYYADMLQSSTYPAMPDRGFSSETCKHYSIFKVNNQTVLGYYDEESVLSAVKIRSPDKDFSIQGDWKEALLFGQHLFSKGGKFLTITEGEMDAAAAFQMMGSRYPVVSIRNGAGSAYKDCKANYEWIDSYETIVVCFDNDEVGKKAAKEVAELFGSKCKIVNLTHYKDANDYLVNHKAKDFNQLWWAAENYVPDGIVFGDSLWELVNEPVQLPDACYPWRGLNELTMGLRLAELVTITAGSGLGKSQVLREMFHHLIHTTEFTIGGLFLEENIKKTALSLMSLEAGHPLHLPSVDFTDDGWFKAKPSTIDVTGLRESFDSQVGNGRVYLFDHFGSTAVDNIVNRIKYMARALGCKIVFLDHISIVVSSQQNGDERRAIDEIMTRLRMVAQELNILIIAVSHLKRPDGKGHEDGAATSLSQLRGSGSIAQLSDIVLGLERDSQNDDDRLRNTTIVRVLKNRFSGDTGKACELLYNKDNGRMTEWKQPIEEL